MKLSYFSDTDSLHIELSPKPSINSDEVSDGIVLDFDDAGSIVGIDIDHAKARFDLEELSIRHLPVQPHNIVA